MIEIDVNDANCLEECEAVLKSGEVLVIPTDTVYGLACLPNPESISKLRSLKNREQQKPFALLIGSLDGIESFGILNGAGLKAVAQHFWPGPLTVVTCADKNFAELLGSPEAKVGIRIPDCQFVLKLIKTVGPIVATSANLSREPVICDPREFISSSLADGVALVVNAGILSDTASTVVDISGGIPKLVREGPIAMVEILKVLNQPA